MNEERFRRIAEEELAKLPAEILASMHNVVIMVEDFADAATLAELDMENPETLLGLYRGQPLPQREVSAAGGLPDMIFLYRNPILALAQSGGEDIRTCIRQVLMHEIGHYFGFSDAQMEQIECR